MSGIFLHDWQILKSGSPTDFAIIIAITAIFLFVITMNGCIIFTMTSTQTKEIEKMQLDLIRSELQ